MKTAMQQLFEWLENSSDIENDILDWEIVKANALEKEKEQIIDAFDYGYYCASNGTSAEITLDGKMHYNQNYNQNK